MPITIRGLTNLTLFADFIKELVRNVAYIFITLPVTLFKKKEGRYQEKNKNPLNRHAYM